MRPQSGTPWPSASSSCSWVTLTASVLMVLLSGGCSKPKPAVGRSCSDQDLTTCLDPKSALACKGGVWAAVPCNGPGGCAAGAREAKCDDLGSKPDDPCLPTRKGHSLCYADGSQLLNCNGDRWMLSSCDGVGRCVATGGDGRCTGTIQPGTACTQSLPKMLCSIDRRAIVACEQGTYQPALPCGSRKCVVSDRGAECQGEEGVGSAPEPLGSGTGP